jgi:hypothetical protein
MSEKSPKKTSSDSDPMQLVNRYLEDLRPGSLRWGGVNLFSCVDYDGITPVEEYREIQKGFVRDVFQWARIDSNPFEELPEDVLGVSWRLNFSNGTNARIIKRKSAGSPGDFEFILL